MHPELCGMRAVDLRVTNQNSQACVVVAGRYLDKMPFADWPSSE